MRMGGQVRATYGVVLGWDMSAAFAFASALGVSAFLVAELLPEIETVASAKANERMRTASHG